MGDHRQDWEGLTRSMTAALAGAVPVWEAVRKGMGSLGEIRQDEGAESPVWSVPIDRITPPPRRSVLDYARVREVEPDYVIWHKLIPPRPVDVSESSGSPGPGPWITEEGHSARRSLLQEVELEAVPRGGQDVMGEVFASMRDEVLADVEGEARKALAGAERGDGLAYENRLENTRGPGSYEKVILGARHVLDAGRSLAEGSPQVAFPHGLFCLLSPSQAVQLMLDGALDAGRMSVCGIDVVVSPVLGGGMGPEALGAMVAAKGSVDVALSKAEIRMVTDARACRIEMGYAVGVKLCPRMTARIVTEIGGGSLEIYG